MTSITLTDETRAPSIMHGRGGVRDGKTGRSVHVEPTTDNTAVVLSLGNLASAADTQTMLLGVDEARHLATLLAVAADIVEEGPRLAAMPADIVR